MRKLEIGKNEAGQRMDKYLKKYFREAGSGFLYKMLRKKNILLNDKKAEGKEMLQSGDVITVYLAEETIEKFRGITGKEAVTDHPYPTTNLDIIYEDEHFLILNKPAGMLSQKATPKDVSMVEYLTGYLLEKKEITQEQLETFHPSVCNRLDRNTSGLILAGKTLPGLQAFSRVLKDRSIQKYYLTLVKGHITAPAHNKAYLRKNGTTNQVEVYDQMVKNASVIETAYEPLWTDGKVTLLKVELITGKSHQIRSHLASLGHPLAGDPKYGIKGWNQMLLRETGLKRQFLHAWEMKFGQEEGILQSLNNSSVKASLPEDLKKVLAFYHVTGKL